MPAPGSQHFFEFNENIRGLIFDFDGTLVDSMPANLLSWKEAFDAFGRTFDEDFFYTHAGVSLVGVVRLYNEKHGTDLNPEKVAALKTTLHQKHIPQTKLIDPVFDIVTRFHRRIPMAVASGNARSGIEAVMNALSIAHYFEAVICGEDVVSPKPAPDCFLAAAARLQVAPERCVVFEDAAPGLEGARRAGMQAMDVRPWIKAS